MRLISLTANNKSFHPIKFHDGVNIIMAKQVTPHTENDGNTYNGVGKSFILHLIHFCLGSNYIKSFENSLPDWEFTLEFSINNNKYYSKRKTIKTEKIDFNGELLGPRAVQVKLLNLCFGIKDTPKNMTWTTLFSRFIRRYRVSYNTFDSYVPKESDYSKLLNNCYLLGIDIDLIEKKMILREEQKNIIDTEKMLKKDNLFRQYYMGNSDAEIDEVDLEERIKNLESVIGNFKVSSNYHDLEKEADDVSFQKKKLENKRAMITGHIKNIKDSLNESNHIKTEKLYEVYNAAQVEVPEMIKKQVDAVLKFHEELLLTRNRRLKKELVLQYQSLQEIDNKINQLGIRMDELLGYLNSHGALEEYTALTKQLADLRNELNHIHEYQRILKVYREKEREIKSNFISQDKETDMYMEDNEKLFSSLKKTFRDYTKWFYKDKRSGLIINNNSGENTIRYILDARIEDDSSDGVNEVRLFCFDLLLFLCKQSNIRFMFHDSRLFANMDPRQRETIFRKMAEICKKEDVQYICSINEDALQSIEPMMQQDYHSIIEKNVILELNDDSAESKLLGIQVDIDLEQV